MRFVISTALTAGLVVTPASAQIVSLQVQNGDSYLQTPTEHGRLTHDGQVSEASISNDRQLVAYVRKGPLQETSAKNDLYVCSVAKRACVLAVQGRESHQLDENDLGDISNVRFSLQAGAGQNGTLNGSIFFLSEVGQVTTHGMHRLTLQGKTLQQVTNSPAPFVTYASSLEIVPSGKYAGALRIVETRIIEFQGPCGADVIFDPNNGRVLQHGPFNHC